MKHTTHDPLAWLEDELASLDDRELRRYLHVRDGAQGARIEFDGQSLVNFGSNDYLGLAGDTRLTQAAAQATEQEGWGAGASPLIVGRSQSHALLEQRLAEFEGTEAALLFNTGFAANVGAIAALVGRGDAVYGDELNHASIIDGCRLSRAEVQVYPHRNVQALERLLESSQAYRRRLIVTDTLFSMDGDLAPLAELAALAERYDCMLMVDEAHATGVFGKHGRGVAEQLGVEQGVHVRIGTLSKGLGCSGGFVCGSRSLVDWLVNRARSYVFSTAPPPAASAAALAALEIVAAEPARREQLLARAAELRDRLRSQGWDVGDSASQIIPIVVGEPAAALQLAATLKDRGFIVPAIRPPSVPPNRCLLRLSLSYAHTSEMIDELCAALQACRG